MVWKIIIMIKINIRKKWDQKMLTIFLIYFQPVIQIMNLSIIKITIEGIIITLII